jgi:hypothetical protein
MNISQSIKIPLLLLSFGLSAFFSYAQSLTSLYSSDHSEKGREVMQDNEFEGSETRQSSTIYCNPLLLDGHSLEYGTFTIYTKGELALITGKPESSWSTKIPFFIRLRRGGKIVNNKNMDFLHKQLYEIEISTVLAFSQLGDQLIITPVNKVDWKAKRILKIIL